MVVSTRLQKGSLVALVFGAGFFGCGGNTSEGKATPVARGDFASQAADAVCTLLASCCPQANLPYDGNACRTGYQSVVENVLSNPKVTYDENAAGECLAAARSAQCDDTAALNPVCRNVFNGTVPAGGACSTPSVRAGYVWPEGIGLAVSGSGNMVGDEHGSAVIPISVLGNVTYSSW